MTYEDICKKVGFDPLKDEYPYKLSDHEDDRLVSPFSKLTIEESDFLVKYIFGNKKASDK